MKTKSGTGKNYYGSLFKKKDHIDNIFNRNINFSDDPFVKNQDNGIKVKRRDTDKTIRLS